MNVLALIALLLSGHHYKLLCVSTREGGGDPCVIWYDRDTLWRYETDTGELIVRDLTYLHPRGKDRIAPVRRRCESGIFSVQKETRFSRGVQQKRGEHFGRSRQSGLTRL